MTTIDDEARRLERSINERATEILKNPAAVSQLLGNPGPIFRERSSFEEAPFWDGIPEPTNNHADVLHALARQLGDEWQWEVAESACGDAELHIIGHLGKQRRIASLADKEIPRMGVVGRVEWEDGQITYVSAARLRDLRAPFMRCDRINVEGEDHPLKVLARAGR